MTVTKVVLFSVLGLLLICGLGFLATGGDLAIYRFWAPKQAAAEREVYVNTPQYVTSKQEYLESLETEYETADDAHKAALRSKILTESASVNNNLLSPELRGFISGLRGQQ